MPVITYKCPNCGGALKYDPEKGKFSCDYCGSEFDEDTLNAAQNGEDVRENEKKEDAAESVVYTCPSCGAELVTDDTTAATFCYYCHSPVVLSGRLADEMKPDYVLPFIIPKEKAEESFLEWIKKKKYVPKDFYGRENIEKLTGVYYPYWLADYETEAHFSGEGRDSSVMSTATEIITTTKHYNVEIDCEVNFANVPRGALKKADKKLIEGVHPYDFGKMIDFSIPYLSGFMAEKRDTEASEIEDGVESEIKGCIAPIVESKSNHSSVSGNTSVKFTGKKFKYALLPAWVLTYREKENIYYYIMNGQNGKTMGVLPLAKSRLLKSCLIYAAAVFIFLCAGGYFIW